MKKDRAKRLEALRREFEVVDKGGKAPLWDVLSQSIADAVNRKHGRELLVPRTRTGRKRSME